MATFNTYVKLGTRGNSLLSFNLSGCTTNNKNSCTALPDYQDVLHTRFDGLGLYVTGLTLHSTYFIYVEANRQVLGSNCNPLLTNQMLPITGIPTPTPTPSPTPTNTSTPVPTATPTNTPIPCSFDANVVYGLPGTTPPTSPPTATPTATPTSFNVKYGLVSNGASAACNASNSLNITTNNGEFCSATYVYGVASLPSGLYFLVYNNNTINVNVTSLNNTGEVVSAGCQVCPDIATPTPTPTNTTAPAGATNTPTPTPTNTTAPAGATNTPTPTATAIPFQLTVFTGNSLSTACDNLVNPLLEPTILFYQGSLGVGTQLYINNDYTTPVVPTVYCALDSSTVYVVGTPADDYGEITEITSCPAATLEPTPIPEPTTYDVYEKCSLDGTKYHVDYNVSNLTQVTINGFCCYRIDSNVTPENMVANHNSSIYFSSFTNANCICN